MSGLVVLEPVALVPVCPVVDEAWPAVPELAVPAVPAAPVLWPMLAAITPAVAKCSAADGLALVQWSATLVTSVTWSGV
jgi:hypothetical protein